jgi:hypothetical protein
LENLLRGYLSSSIGTFDGGLINATIDEESEFTGLVEVGDDLSIVHTISSDIDIRGAWTMFDIEGVLITFKVEWFTNAHGLGSTAIESTVGVTSVDHQTVFSTKTVFDLSI